MRKAIQPYESHLQYIPQWMCDYNLYGCAYMDAAKVSFRDPVPDYLEISSTSHQWHSRSISPSMISDEAVFARQSHCALEVDICVQDILNRLDIRPRLLHHDFVEQGTPSVSGEKLVHSMAGLWKDETRRRKGRLGMTDSDGTPFPPEVLVSVSADPRNTQPGGWVHEQELKARISALITDEKESSTANNITSYREFIEAAPLESRVKTAFESIEDLYPLNLLAAISSRQLLSGKDTTKSLREDDIDVDESKILPAFNDDYQYESDEDTAREAEISQQKEDYDRKSQGKLNIDSTVSDGDIIRRTDVIQETEAAINSNDASGLTQANSSSELENVGVRNCGDYSHMSEDAFVIPVEYASDLVSNVTQLNQVERAEESIPGSHKRRKLIHDIQHSYSLKNTCSSIKSNCMSSNNVIEFNPLPITNESYFDEDMVLQLASHNRSAWSSLTTSRENSTSLQTVEMASRIHQAFDFSRTKPVVYFASAPPTTQTLKSFNRLGFPSTIYPGAHYGNDDDVPLHDREYAGREFRLEGTSVPFLPNFFPNGITLAVSELRSFLNSGRRAGKDGYRRARKICTIRTWQIEKLPPTRLETERWVRENPLQPGVNGQLPETEESDFLSQVDGPTPKNTLGFKYSQKQASTSVSHETEYMSLMSLEVHVNTRSNLAPNPELDEISCIFWCLDSGTEEVGVDGSRGRVQAGIVTLSDSQKFSYNVPRHTGVDVDEEATELDLVNRMVDIVREHDPDVLTGFEVHNGSWGYVIERARQKYDYNLCDEFSRMKSQSHGRFGKESDRWGFNQTSTIRITGRHIINIWRAMRGELNLLQYTMENIVFHTLHRRMPHFPFHDLTKWYCSSRPRDRAKVIEYYLSRAQVDLEILEQNELIPRTSEQARLLGVDFFSVLSRGSQFKVESLMFRIAKPENFILVSPSRKQVGQQNALECLPLVMEPQSAFYTSPVLVLDFQSLYPSVMIAYNYCYSTFLGRVVQWRGQNKMGFTDFKRGAGLLDLLKEQINIAPNGMMYAKPNIRKSLLAEMLGEILETRVMIKSGMKVDKEDRTLQRLLNNRQLALKLIANVTYGYTSASFSGRMPCSEIADSIVQTGRETLEKAIALIHSVERWDAEVVYGDTDSLFVHLKGRSKAEAFVIGKEIARAVTDVNPRPVKLKFEKVYHPCVLLAKKRYVGFKYENENQKEPEFDAKGIETVRRDGTPGEQKIEENALKILFRTADLSQVKAYFQNQCAKIMKGKVSVQDFCFAKEVKLGTYSDKGAPPPGALISTRRMLEDPRAEPQYGERIPYVVIAGAPGARLIDRCVAPEVLLHDDQNELDSEYYISKNIIPPLERIFNLVGANVRQWYDEMPKYQRIRRIEGMALGDGKEPTIAKKTLESYMKSSACSVCRGKLDADFPVCEACVQRPQNSLFTLRSRLKMEELKATNLARICRSCVGHPFGDEVCCDSKDCPVFYTRTKHAASLKSKRAMVGSIMRIFTESEITDLEW